jgi:hypothetical protein
VITGIVFILVAIFAFILLIKTPLTTVVTENFSNGILKIRVAIGILFLTGLVLVFNAV